MREKEKILRNQLGIYDGSYLDRILKNDPAWVGTYEDGEQIIFRCPRFMMAYVIHDIGRYFSKKVMDFSKPGTFKAKVKFKVHLYDNPSEYMENVELTVPYTVSVKYDPRSERMDPQTSEWVGKIQSEKTS